MRIRTKHTEYSKSGNQLPHVLNDPHYERLLEAFANFHTIALFIEKDLHDTTHSTNFHMAMYYLEFFRAAEQFEKLLDTLITKREEQL